MRIKKLIIQAFGPFKDRVVIDFSKNKIDKGLLLITGDTGAGKTSIFDAVCFALYGEASSNLRKVNSLRSDFASPDIDTFVELVFEHNNKVFIVKRSPEYERRSKRGGGTTKQVATAEFEINGRIEVKPTAVTKEIEDLLGLDYKQFHQVSMLSQGEFTKFLLASSDEKTSIFRKIFNTDIFNKVMYKLKDDLTEKEQEFNFIKNSINKEREKIDNDKFKICSNEDLIVRLEEKIILDKNEINVVKMQRDNLNEIIKSKQSIYDKLNELNVKIFKYNEVHLMLENLAKDNQNINDEKALLEYNRNVVIEVSNVLKELEHDNKELNENLEKNKVLQEKKKQLDSDLKNRANDFKQLETFNDLLDSLNKELNEYKKYLDKLNEYNKFYNKLLNVQKEYRLCIDEYKVKESDFLLIKGLYYADLAYSLANNLEDNKPCPVCGAFVHPHIAEKNERTVTKSELDKKEKEVTELLKNQKAYESMINEYNTYIKDLNLKKDFDYKIEVTTTNESIKIIEEKIVKLKEDNKKLLIEKQNLDSAFIKVSSDLETVTNNLNKYTVKVKCLKDNLNVILVQNNTSLEEYESKKLLKSDLLILENKIKNFDKLKIEYEATINTLKDEVEGKKVEILDTKKIEIDNLTKQYMEFDKDYLNKSNELTKVNDIKNNLKKYLKEYKTIYKDYCMIKELSDTANAKLIGKQKITFENYVLSYYLNNILIEANKRLSKMTDTRYELRRKEIGNLNEKIGLEFSVFDAYTGKERDVSSLSGGEKFKASLALALGLSDIISMFAGGIKMDCLFVDEGFGSLDQESLNQALNILMDLADNDKLIGIISHVSELISRIDNKIIVKKDNNGSSLEVEV